MQGECLDNDYARGVKCVYEESEKCSAFMNVNASVKSGLLTTIG